MLNYKYDSVGNRTEKWQTVGVNTEIIYYHYDSGDTRGNGRRLLYETKRGVDGFEENLRGYRYDANGNMVAKSNRFAVSGGTVTLVQQGLGVEYWEYEYDVQNRLVKVWKNGGVVAEYSYDVEGMRVTSTLNGETAYFIHSHTGHVLFERKENEWTQFVFANGRILTEVRGNKNGNIERYYYHSDHLGSTRLVSNDTGKIVNDSDYLPFGEILPQVQFSQSFNYGYTGQYNSSEINLYYYGARFYEPSTGRFITEDTFLGVHTNPHSLNLYIYVMQNPLKYVDPSGHAPKKPEGIIFEKGTYNGLEYTLITIDLNSHIIKTYCKIVKKEDGVTYYQFPISELHNDTKPELTVNGGFFAVTFNRKTASVGDVIIDGKYQPFVKVKTKDNFDPPYFLGIKEKDGKQRFVFGQLELQKDGYYEGTYLIPKNYRDKLGEDDLDYAIGNVGPLIQNGQISNKKTAYHKAMWEQKTERTIFGVNEEQNKAYFFIGRDNWSLDGVASFIKSLDIYNAVFLDSGGSTQYWTNDKNNHFYTTRPISTTLQVYEKD